uniref:LAM_G_DOMAIN domain-containing protein n=1 Tax=Mesocestoides corti TaxID=53468 RepID=A0A5K3FYY3_MESCO
MNDMKRHDNQRVQRMMKTCLSKRPCRRPTTHFYVASDADQLYDITITYLGSTSPNKNILFSFRLSADVLDLNVTTCIENGGVIMAHRNHLQIRFSDVVLRADVIVDARNRLNIANTQVGFGSISSGGVNFDNNYYNLLVQKLAKFIDKKC